MSGRESVEGKLQLLLPRIPSSCYSSMELEIQGQGEGPNISLPCTHRGSGGREGGGRERVEEGGWRMEEWRMEG